MAGVFGIKIRELKVRPQELKGLKPILITSDNDYLFNRIAFFINSTDLFVRFSGNRIKGRWVAIELFEKYTALEVIKYTSFGRHFEDGILKIWKNNGLELGWAKRILR